MSLLTIPRELLHDIAFLILGTDNPLETPSAGIFELAQTCQLLRSVCLTLIYTKIVTSSQPGRLEALLADYPSIAASVRVLTVYAPDQRFPGVHKIRKNYWLQKEAIKAAEPPPAKWVQGILENCTGLRELVVEQARTPPADITPVKSYKYMGESEKAEMDKIKAEDDTAEATVANLDGNVTYMPYIERAKVFVTPPTSPGSAYTASPLVLQRRRTEETIFTTPEEPLSWPTSIRLLKGCKNIRELVLSHPAPVSAKGAGRINFNEFFLAYVAPEALQTISTVRFQSFRIVSMITQFGGLLEAGFANLHTFKIEKFNMNNPPSFQENERLKKQLDGLSTKLQLPSVREFCFETVGNRSSRLDTVLGEILAEALPNVTILRLKTGADFIHSMLGTYSRVATQQLKVILFEVPPPSYQPIFDPEHRKDFCDIIVKLSPSLTKFVMRCGPELRICHKLFTESQWLLLKDLQVRCAMGCEGVQMALLKRDVEARSLKRGKVSVHFLGGKKPSCVDNHRSRDR